MMATVLHVTSSLGLRKFQVDGFLLTRLYIIHNLLFFFVKLKHFGNLFCFHNHAEMGQN